MNKKAFTQNKNHSRMLLSGISALENTKAVETPDRVIRGWTNVRAFTLIELLVVVLIIGILAAIALPQYEKAVLKSRFVQLKILGTAIAQAQEEVYLATGAYTSDADALAISLPTPASIDGSKFVYSWGNCSLAGTVAADCKLTDGVLKYMVYYVHLPNEARAGKAECTAAKSNTNAVNICKQETGQSTAFWESDDHAAYSY